jgi:hypothetical protein
VNKSTKIIAIIAGAVMALLSLPLIAGVVIYFFIVKPDGQRAAADTARQEREAADRAVRESAREMREAADRAARGSVRIPSTH